MGRKQVFLDSATPPWGTWEVLLNGPGYKVKRIIVNPGHKLSYQKHFRRKEHWFVVGGKGLFVLDGQEIIAEPGKAVDIGIEVAHRAINPGEEPLVFIEVQSGDYLGEDDIVRLEDSYGREDK